MPERRRVLLIEDSPTQAERLRLLLEAGGLEVVLAASAEAALDELEPARPDAIVLDYYLPGMNGGEFCQSIRLNVNTRAIPILMLTVEGSDAAQMRGLESGADDYLSKSEDPDILLARVRNLLRKSGGASAIVDIEHRFSRTRVLAIDDSPTYLQLLSQELEAEHYEVEKAPNADAGLECLRQKPFDCVLVDYELHAIDGAEVCRRIAKLRSQPGAAIVVIMLTSHDDKEHMMLGLDAGADDYIAKSTDMSVIKARIRALLRRKFLIEENRRIVDELREKELETVRARAEQAAAEVRATLADQLAAANGELETANRKLEEALNVTRAITENAAEALLMVDPEGLVSFVNPAAAKMFGFRPEDLLGRPLYDKLKHSGPDGAPLSGADYPLARALATATTITGIDGVFSTRGGIPVDVACSFAPIVQQARVTGAVLALHNVSERKRAEERLRQSQKLESLGVLAGGIAHDFNNLLTGILGNTSLAIDMLPPGSEVASILSEIVAASERAAHLTRQMLAYSGKGRFIVEPVDLSRLAHDMTKLLQASISKKVTVGLQLGRDLPPVEADAGQMQQVIMNLVINAAEAIGEDNGIVTVRTSVQNVSARYIRQELNGAEIAPGEYVRLEVLDTGCGMDEATQAKIFDPFFSTKFTGRGLGLAAVAGIVRSHQGAMKVVSAPGKGSSFLVLLPAGRAQKGAPAEPAPPDEHRGAGVVLVVDDEEVVLRAASLALTHHGYTVLEADSGQAAIEILAREKDRVALALLDLSMPGMSGLETLPELRRIKPDLAVIISSGYGEEETMRLFAGQQVSGFVQKPYTSARLARAILKVASRFPMVRCSLGRA